jgi:hypothetical protein
MFCFTGTAMSAHENEPRKNPVQPVDAAVPAASWERGGRDARVYGLACVVALFAPFVLAGCEEPVR